MSAMSLVTIGAVDPPAVPYEDITSAKLQQKIGICKLFCEIRHKMPKNERRARWYRGLNECYYIGRQIRRRLGRNRKIDMIPCLYVGLIGVGLGVLNNQGITKVAYMIIRWLGVWWRLVESAAEADGWGIVI